MDQLSEHIETLLAYHDYVVVPQLGGFITQKQSAIINPGKVIAPHISIAFNPLMKHADGLLAIEIARSQSITFRHANEIIHEEVEKVLKQLNEGKNFILGKIGTLSKDKSGNIQFEPASKNAFLPVNFLVSDLHLNQKTKSNKNDHDRLTITLPRVKTIRNVAAAVFLLFLTAISQQVNDVRKTEFADLVSLEFVKIPEVTVMPDPCPELVISNEAGVDVITNTEELYHVVVASLPTKEMAYRYCEELKTQSYECAHVLEPVKTYRVVIKSFDQKGDAIEFMEKLRLTDEQFSSAWVLCKH